MNTHTQTQTDCSDHMYYIYIFSLFDFICDSTVQTFNSYGVEFNILLYFISFHFISFYCAICGAKDILQICIAARERERDCEI